MKKNGIIKRLGRKERVMEEKKDEYCIITEGIRGSRTKKLGKEEGREKEGEEKKEDSRERGREGSREGGNRGQSVIMVAQISGVAGSEIRAPPLPSCFPWGHSYHCSLGTTRRTPTTPSLAFPLTLVSAATPKHTVFLLSAYLTIERLSHPSIL